ncbi:NAD-dependent epimerase/dehydratase family protein [[Eubacterium] cellulosolvens]
MTRLITGGTGFVGSELANRLVERGDEVILFDVSPNVNAVKKIKDKITIIRGDLSNWSEVFNAVKNYNIKSIFHLGAMLSIPADTNPWAAYRVNADGTFNILEAARLFDVEKVIFTSTTAVYAGYGLPINESTLRNPESMYGITKLFCENLGRFYFKKFGLDFRAIRYPTVIGLGARTKHMSQYMSWMIENSLSNKSFDVWVNEDTRNPCLYYKDAVLALLMIHDAPCQNIKTRVYNLAGISLTAKEFVDKVKKHIPSANITFKPDPEIVKLMGKGFGMIDDTCAKKEWEWKMRYDMETMLDDIEREYKFKINDK